MTVVYVDSVFALNAVMDYLVLLLTARLAGTPLYRRRYLLAALLGGGYAVAVFWPGWDFLGAIPVKLAVGVLIALIAFGGEERFLRLTLLMLAVSCGLAGCVLGLGLLANSRIPMARGIFYTDIDLRVLAVSAAAAYGGLGLVFRAAARHGVRGELILVRVSVLRKTVSLTALWDSGNSLRETESGQPVLVVAPGELGSVLPGELRVFMTEERLRDPASLLAPLMAAAPSLRPRLLPFRAVGTSGGLLLMIRADWIEICGERIEGGFVALSPTALGMEYGALWGGPVRKGGKNGDYFKPSAKAAGTVGSVSAK